MKKTLLILLLLLIRSFNTFSQIQHELVTLTTKPNTTTTICNERPGTVRSIISGITLNDIPDLGEPISIGDNITVRFVCYDSNNNRIYNRRRKIKVKNVMSFNNRFVWISSVWNPKTSNYDKPSGQIRVGIGFIKGDDYLNPFKEITKIFNVCDNDYDLDGIENSVDNCPNKYNPNQNDKDNDGKGDVCDTQDNRDSDGDGIQNWKDDCPNKKGPSSNNGCPLPTGKPDLILDLDESYSITSGCQCSIEPLHKKTHYSLYFGESLQLTLRVNNIGKVSSGDYKVGIYSYGGTNDIKKATLIKEYNFYSISPNGFQTSHSIDLKFNDFNIFANSTYLYIKIDNNNDVNEGNTGEKNNTFSYLKLNIYNTFRPLSRKPIGHQFDLISIKDEFGKNIKSNVKTINKIQEQNLIKSLPKGLYYINKNGKKSQIYKRD